MPCPECEAVRVEYGLFRRSVISFAKTLGRLEAERLRIINTQRPEGMPEIGRLARIIAEENGYAIRDLPPDD